MDNQIVRRRADIIAAHLAFHEDISATAAHVFPMSCSNSVNSVIRRYDNRMNFARQGSGSQGCYMRQALSKQGNYVQPAIPSKSTNCRKKVSNSLDAPSFSKPAQVEPGIPTFKGIKPVDQGRRYVDPAPDAPTFARPTKEDGRPKFHSVEKTQKPAQIGSEWSPRMNVAESGYNYVITLEIPGVSIENVKVEVDDRSLIISGSRLNLSCGSACSNKSVMSYHRREILQGLYRVVWPLPSNTKKENVSAEIQMFGFAPLKWETPYHRDGLLRVTIPKVSGLRWLRKAYM